MKHVMIFSGEKKANTKHCSVVYVLHIQATLRNCRQTVKKKANNL